MDIKHFKSGPIKVVKIGILGKIVGGRWDRKL